MLFLFLVFGSPCNTMLACYAVNGSTGKAILVFFALVSHEG